jgi:hypothetical protein
MNFSGIKQQDRAVFLFDEQPDLRASQNYTFCAFSDQAPDDISIFLL